MVFFIKSGLCTNAKRSRALPCLTTEFVCLLFAGTVIIKMIMQSTYTFSAYYTTDIPRHSFGERTQGKIQLLEPATVRMKEPTHHYFPATMMLLCSHNGNKGLVDVVEEEDSGVFPVASPNAAIFRPADHCVYAFQ